MVEESDSTRPTIFIRALEADDKAEALSQAIASPQETLSRQRFEVDPQEFSQVPGSPFAYWAGPKVLSAFSAHDRFEGEECTARQGLATADDFRFVRLWTEVSARSGRWCPFAKGGSYSPFYADVYLVVNWYREGSEIVNFVNPKTGRPYSRPQNIQFYSRPGLTWPLRTQSGLSLRAVPKSCIFGHKGPVAFVEDDDSSSLLALLAIANSKAFSALVSLQMAFGSYEVGVIQRTPVPELSASDQKALAELARRAWSSKRILDTAEQTSHAFFLPALLQGGGDSLAERARGWDERVSQAYEELERIQEEIDARCFELYGFRPEDQGLVHEAGGDSAPEDGDEEDEEGAADEGSSQDAADLAKELVDWLVGAAFGRFDVRLATGERSPPSEPEPFDPLPACSPGMLTDEQGLPAEVAPVGYPLSLPPDGLLVEDAGLDDEMPARWDIVQRVRAGLEVIFGDARAHEVEAELCELLGVDDLRTYLQRSSKLFQDHLKRYSKSRRKAPLLWPLSVNERRYTIWLYYPRLTADTLYTAIRDHVAPKIAHLEERRAQLEVERQKAEGAEAGRLGQRISEINEALDELGQLRDQLEEVAGLPYRPSQDDGVQITAAPLHGLFRLTSWRRDLEKIWGKLQSGEYDWAHLAYAIWPDRVEGKCRSDRSLAIAHDREDLYEGGS